MVAVRAAASIAVLTRECPLHKAVELAQTDEAPEVSPSSYLSVDLSITAHLTEIPPNINNYAEGNYLHSFHFHSYVASNRPLSLFCLTSMAS